MDKEQQAIEPWPHLIDYREVDEYGNISCDERTDHYIDLDEGDKAREALERLK